MSSSNHARRAWPGLLLITALAACIQGYHLGADDAAIYVPGIKQAADPRLYPFGAEFFQSHAHLTLFVDIVGGSARLTHLPTDLVIFAWHLAGLFLFMLAAWQLACVCFQTQRARWGGVALLGAVLSVPVTGTALMIADPYVTSRTLSTPATIFAITAFVSGRHLQAAGWWLITAAIHPQMSAYAAVFLGGAAWSRRRTDAIVEKTPAPDLAYFSLLPFLFVLEPACGPAREALLSRTYFFVSQWTWYEWIGVFAPLALLWWLGKTDLRGTSPAVGSLARSLLHYGLLFTATAVVLSSTARLENYTRLQPMRALHLLYIIFFLFLGAVAGEYVLRQDVWRWAALFMPLALAMFLVQRYTYPDSEHIEWPGRDQEIAGSQHFFGFAATRLRMLCSHLILTTCCSRAKICTAFAPSPRGA